MKIKVGEHYTVVHPRKGKFGIEVIDVNEQQVTGIITDGRATFIAVEANLIHGAGQVGTYITLDRDWCRFYRRKKKTP